MVIFTYVNNFFLDEFIFMFCFRTFIKKKESKCEKEKFTGDVTSEIFKRNI